MSQMRSEAGCLHKVLDKPPSRAAVNPFNIPLQHVLHEMPGCAVVRTGSTAHKFGTGVTIGESVALKFASSIGIPVPRTYNVRQSDSGGLAQCAIEMDFVEGQTLHSAWPNMAEKDKISVAQQLRQILVAMRWVAPPPDVMIGAVEGHPARDIREIDIYTGGPFASEKDFNEFQMNFYSSASNVLVEEIRSRLRHDHKIVFSHGDLNQRNIMVKGSTVVAILDWEVAGWYPEHWDFIKFFFQLTPHWDWHDYARLIFPETYFDELLLRYNLQRWQRD